MTEDKKRIIALGKGSSGGGGDAVWGSIGGTITDQRDLMTELNKKANKSSLATVATSGDYDDLTNKPNIPSKTSDLNNDSGYITISDVPAQVQSNWNETDTESPAYIVGKPSIPEAQVQSDWNQSDNQAVDYIKNKPTIPAAQVNSDWNAVSGVAQILNKPSFATVATSGSYTDLSNTPTIPDAVSGTNDGTNWTSITIGDVTKAIPNGGGVSQIQSDWNQSDNTKVDYIKNKPSIPAAQIQSDWNQSDNTQVDYIKNKPTIPAAQVNSDWNASSGVAQILNKPSMTTTTLTFVDANNVETNVVVYTQPTI